MRLKAALFGALALAALGTSAARADVRQTFAGPYTDLSVNSPTNACVYYPTFPAALTTNGLGNGASLYSTDGTHLNQYGHAREASGIGALLTGGTTVVQPASGSRIFRRS